MKKKAIAMILASVMAISTVGCGGNKGADNADTQNSSETESTEAAGVTGEILDVDLDAGKDYTQGNQVTIKFAHTNEPGTPLDRSARSFAETLDELTDGRIKATVYPSSQLGGNIEVLEQLQMGSVEMCYSAVANLGSFTNATELLDLPFLFKTEEAAQEALNGEIGISILDGLQDAGFVGLQWIEDGYRELSCNKEIHTPDDLKGVKLRVMDSESHIKIWSTLGASTTPMAASEVFTALQNGTIDAQENPLVTIQSSRFSEVQKYIVMTNHIYSAIPMLTSKQWWDGLSADDQELIQKVAEAARIWQVEENRKTTQEVYDEWKESGNPQIIDLTDEEYNQWKEKTSPIYEEASDQVKEWVSQIDEINAKY